MTALLILIASFITSVLLCRVAYKAGYTDGVKDSSSSRMWMDRPSTRARDRHAL